MVKEKNKQMPEPKTWSDFFNLAAPVQISLLNAMPTFHSNEAIQAVALIGAGAILSKASALVSRDEYITACLFAWDAHVAEFETVEMKAH